MVVPTTEFECVAMSGNGKQVNLLKLASEKLVT